MTIVVCAVAAAAVVAIDALFSAQEGYLARPPYYDGAGYMFFARSDYELILGLHVRTAFHQFLHAITPGWNAVIALQYFAFGPGSWQAFTVRFWPVALLLVLVYSIVRKRTQRSIALAATALTALLPMVSAGVRSSSLEYLTGFSNYLENWYLDDLRPDLFAIALILCAVAILAEHVDTPNRQSYIASAVLAATAVLTKPSTSPLLLLVWTGALAVVWFVNRGRAGSTRDASLAAALLAVLLAPWATLGGGITNVITYLYEASVTYGSVYNTTENIVERFWYFAVRIPTDLGLIEGSLTIAATAVVTIALARRMLGPAELIYGAVALAFFVTFSVTTTRNTHIPEWTSMALWIYAWAGVARLASRWRWPRASLEPALVGAVALYTLLVYCVGIFALVHWPANEHASAVQLSAVTNQIAGEMGHRIAASDCFVSSPGPGWPASIQFLLVDSRGEAPGTIGIDPSVPPAYYVQAAKSCAAVLTFREDVSIVAQAFSALPPYQPYYRAVDFWVRNDPAYARVRSWSFSDLPPYDPHPLGHYKGLSLTVDLFVRGAAVS